MKAYHEQIVDNAVAYIAQQYKNYTGKNIVQILMYKILALFDYRCLRETGEPCTELVYKAHERGPVPQQLYRNWRDTELVEKCSARVNKHSAKVFICKKAPNMDYFSEYEMQVLDSIIKRAVEEHWNAKKASEISHDEIKAWRKGRERKNLRMFYSDEFDGIYKKQLNQLSSVEKNFLMYSECFNGKI